MRCKPLVFGAASTVLIVTLASSAVAQTQPGFEQALYKSLYPTGSNDSFICYAETDTPNTFDLTRLCGSVSTPSSVSASPSVSIPSSVFTFPSVSIPSSVSTFPSSNNSYGGASYNKFSGDSGGGTSTGRCNTPNDTAIEGSRCGGQAASERRGGK
ncbi:MAG: hypothetical protein V7L25_04340 [Nostoc sp.]|uniref:hypothetical protein n=1 Tax=Nostoc sp. TaxID=1180 RepID=UPI002FEF9653